MAKRTLTVALVGNPNTGKSTLFNALTGLRQHVGNYPGVTVELSKGKAEVGDTTLNFVDLPGTYSLAARSPDEMVTVDFILGHRPEEPRPDVVIAIVDACNLERHLYLTTQLMSLGVPIVLAVNLIDMAEKKGLAIDFDKIAKQMGLTIVPIQANRGKGLDRLLQTVVDIAGSTPGVTGPAFPEVFEREVADLSRELPGVETFLVHRLLIDVGGHTERMLVKKFGLSLMEHVQSARQRLTEAGSAVPAVEAKTRYAWIRKALTGCVVRPAVRPVSFSDRLDRVLTHKVWGSIIFLALMFVVFEAIFLWAAPIMGLIDSGKEWIAERVRENMDPGPLRSLLADGVIRGVGSVLVFIPQILILFAFIAVLEDCGYMARAAFLMDKIMSKCGLNGKSFIPLLSSVACAIPGIMATRTIENRRDRLATIMVAPLMSCSARLPLYMLLIGVFLSDPWWLPGLALFGMYLLGIIIAPLVALVLKRTLLKGATPLFVMEMPSFKWPQAKTVVRRMFGAGWAFVYRAGTLIFASMILIWALLYFPSSMSDGRSFDKESQSLKKEVEGLEDEAKKLEEEGEESADKLKEKKEQIEEKQGQADNLFGEWKRQSYLGQAGRALEPAFVPLGWDWQIGMAALASFPAREVVVGTIGIIYNQGDVDPKSIREADNAGETPLGKTVKKEWESDPESPRAKHRTAVALGLMVFFALCCQCVSTLAVIRRETGTWSWPVFTFVYMTTLAYLGALITYQVGRLFS
ncbi:MAG: ferrous iron transport protein B [Planctomycetes bacterium]|nr:ferrous iron transport protein B [Planctomycetota bacterium]